MDTIRRQVRRARIRLIAEQFVERLFWFSFLALAIAVAAIAVPKMFVIDSLPARWASLWLIGAMATALGAAAIYTFARRRSELDAAIEIDHRFDLRERVASSIFLSPDDLEMRAGRALVDDAIRRVERIDVGDRFPIRLGRRPWLPLIPAVIAFCLLAFVDDRTRPTQANADVNVEIQKRVKNSAEALRKKIEKKKDEAAAKGLQDVAGLLGELEKRAKELTKKDGPDQKKAVVKLNDLAKQLEDRRNKLGGRDGMKRQFEKLKKIGKGPADKLADAMKKGDFNKAVDELKKLKDQIAKGQLDEKSKKQLQEQLKEMKEKLKEAADAHKQAIDDLKKQIDEQKRQGNTQNASNLQEQLDKLAKKMPQMDQLGDLANKLGQLEQSMKQGDQAAAQKALEQLAEQMQGMQQQLEEMEMLDEMLGQIDEAKNAMDCELCQGEGCGECQGQFGLGKGKGKKPGRGMGEGQGRGPRPDEKNDVAFRDSKVKQKTGKGRAVITGTAAGPNVKGQTRQAIRDEIAAGTHEAADPLATERLPRSRREYAEEYFNAIRKGE